MQYSFLKHDWNWAAVRMGSLVTLAAFASAAWAAPEQPAEPKQPATAIQPVKPAATPVALAQDAPARSSGVDFGPAADLGKLEQSRGGTDMHTDMKLDGVVTGNSAVNVVTGANSIDTGAFANMSGIPVVIQNSGANVLIQNATIVNLQFK